jgi:hypothetical protein
MSMGELPNVPAATFTFPVGVVLEILWNCHSTYSQRFILSLVFQSFVGLA